MTAPPQEQSQAIESALNGDGNLVARETTQMGVQPGTLCIWEA